MSVGMVAKIRKHPGFVNSIYQSVQQ